MKKYIYSIFLGSLLLASCTEDNSTLAHIDVSDIELAPFSEDGYTIISYQGNVLNLSADVKSGYSDAQLSYAWYLIDDAKSSSASTGAEQYARELISEGKILSYEVNLPPATYTIVCEVVADNGYAVTQTAKLYTTTEFTTGFYILNETADGNTEVDLYNPNNGKLIDDVLTRVCGEPMTGKPRTISVSFDHAYIDTEDNVSTSSNMLSISTESNDFRVFTTTDMGTVFDRSSLLFDAMEADEHPYLIVNGYFALYYLSNKGIRTQYVAMWGGGSGKYGIPVGGAASPYAVYSMSTMGLLYWDEVSHSIMSSDFNGGYAAFYNPALPTSNLTDYDCIACGTSETNAYSYFLLENKATNERKLYLFPYGDIGEIRTLPADSHLAQSTKFSTSVTSAAYIYGLHDGKIYTYSIEDALEGELSPKGIAADETITYVSDQTFDRYFTYLVIGTQKGNSYTLYFYDVLGGKPDGEPVFKVQGTGLLKSVRYTEPGFTPMYCFTALPPYVD